MEAESRQHGSILVATAPICRFLLAAWLLGAISPVLSLAQESSSNLQPEMRMYRLPLRANSADISPDERFVAIQTTRALQRTDSEQKYAEFVEVWDFRRLVMVQDSEIAKTNESAQWRSKFVRYTGDGEMLVTYVGDYYLRILRASDLQEIGRINLELNAPRLFEETEDAQFMRQNIEWMAKRLGRPAPTSPHVGYVGLCGLEVAPALRRVAILVCLATWPYRGELRIYDLEAKSLEGMWPSSKAVFGGTIAWRPDGKKVAVLMDTLFQNTLLVIDGSPVADEIKADRFVSSVAFTSDDRILTVGASDVGLIFNRNPKMRIFDAESGKQVKKLGSPLKRGVKWQVAASADSTRVVAYTNVEKAVWDWGEMYPTIVPAFLEIRFTVWEWPSRKVFVTSPDVPEIDRRRLRLSAHGHLVLAYTPDGKGDVFMFEIP